MKLRWKTLVDSDIPLQIERRTRLSAELAKVFNPVICEMTRRPEGPCREKVDTLMDDGFEASIGPGVYKPEEYPGDPGDGLTTSLILEAREGCERQIRESREWFFEYQRKQADAASQNEQRDEQIQECVRPRLWLKLFTQSRAQIHDETEL